MGGNLAFKISDVYSYCGNLEVPNSLIVDVIVSKVKILL